MEKQGVATMVGLGGWEHDVFDRVLYPSAGLTSAEKLAFYAESFDVTEVRATFWDDSLGAHDVEEWAEAVRGNKKFLFAVKLHSSFTHQRVIRASLSKNMRDIAQELSRRDRLGALLAQFPYSFTNTSSNRYHLIKLAELFRGFPLHAELRHESWNFPGLTSFFEEHDLRYVSADMPKVRSLMPCGTTVIGDTAYLRLHGRNEKGWLLNGYDTRYDYLYNGKELREILRRVEALAGRCERIIISCNNSTDGKSVANALQIVAAMRGAVNIPGTSLRAFPFLRDIAAGASAEVDLFKQAG